MYLIVKQFHVILAISSISLFQFRYWRFQVAKKKTSKLFKVLPHGIDTLLLTLGLILAFMAGFTPSNSPWLLFKLVALLIYIFTGMMAMKKSGSTQWLSYLIASFAAVYMLLVARYKTPWFF